MSSLQPAKSSLQPTKSSLQPAMKGHIGSEKPKIPSTTEREQKGLVGVWRAAGSIRLRNLDVRSILVLPVGTTVQRSNVWPRVSDKNNRVTRVTGGWLPAQANQPLLAGKAISGRPCFIPFVSMPARGEFVPTLVWCCNFLISKKEAAASEGLIPCASHPDFATDGGEPWNRLYFPSHGGPPFKAWYSLLNSLLMEMQPCVRIFTRCGALETVVKRVSPGQRMLVALDVDALLCIEGPACLGGCRMMLDGAGWWMVAQAAGGLGYECPAALRMAQVLWMAQVAGCPAVILMAHAIQIARRPPAVCASQNAHVAGCKFAFSIARSPLLRRLLLLNKTE
eukprot:1159392-Pelagomonas_calceolata.AAC.3